MGYKQIRQFRSIFLKTLREVISQYPEAKLADTPRGLILNNSPPPVRKKLIQIGEA